MKNKTQNFKAFDLREKFTADEKSEVISTIQKYHWFTENHPNFKIGDVIEFVGGYNDDILYKSEIIGFTKDKEIFVLWDCYWFSIKEEEKRQIKITK